VIRPRLPLDILQATVGAAENVLVSILGAIRQNRNDRLLVILDDVETIYGETNDERVQSILRLHSIMNGILDSLQRIPQQSSGKVVVILTATQNLSSLSSRIDHVFHLQYPEEQERRALLSSALEIHHPGDREQLLLDESAVATVGKSHAEILQILRQAIETVGGVGVDPQPELHLRVLKALKQRLQMITPESLRGGIVDDYVEMRVLTARDLLPPSETYSNEISYNFPLLGASASNAWKALEFFIILPLCRPKELQDLLDSSRSADRRITTGGVLLTGEPASGKSEIALHCARYAAQLLPSVKFIDVSCTSLVHKEVGGSERAVHHLFEAARKAAPCILLMDGIENIAAVRGNDTSEHLTMDRVLSQILVELDGVTDAVPGLAAGVAVIGITHDELKVDAALKRPGRLSPTVRLSRDW